MEFLTASRDWTAMKKFYRDPRSVKVMMKFSPLRPTGWIIPIIYGKRRVTFDGSFQDLI